MHLIKTLKWSWILLLKKQVQAQYCPHLPPLTSHRPRLLSPLRFTPQPEYGALGSRQRQPFHTVRPTPQTLLFSHIFHVVNSSLSFNTPSVLAQGFQLTSTQQLECLS